MGMFSKKEKKGNWQEVWYDESLFSRSKFGIKSKRMRVQTGRLKYHNPVQFVKFRGEYFFVEPQFIPGKSGTYLVLYSRMTELKNNPEFEILND